MIKTILKKDLHSNVQDAKIQTLAMAILFFSIVITLLGIFEYKIKNERYHVEQAANLEQLYKNQVYATLHPKTIKMPTPLAIFNKGVDANFGNSYTFDMLDISYQADMIYEANAYIESFINLDLSVIFVWFFSLISILFAYDSVVKEKEDGTLKLMFVSRLSKLDFYISKIIASILSVSFVLFISLFVVAAIFLFTPWIEFNLQISYTLFLFFILTLLYSIFWIAVATACSVMFKSSAQSLIVSLSVWILFLIVIPTVVKTIIGNTDYVNEKNEITVMHEDIMRNYYNHRQEVLERDFYPLYNDLRFLTLGGNVDNEPIWAPNPATRNAAINYYNTLNPLKRDIADQKFAFADEKYLFPLKKDIRLLGRLANLSPVMMFERISMQISGTSYEDQFSFLTQFRTYRNQVIDFLTKRNAFSSDRWFTPDDPYMIGHPVCPKDINQPTEEELDKMHDYYSEQNAEKWRLDLNDFPIFHAPLSDLKTKNDFLQGLFVMFFLSCAVFVFGLYRMNKYHNF
jgi:ABC-type transport system involved in multi-copper enzyme maturation permease subunit